MEKIREKGIEKKRKIEEKVLFIEEKVLSIEEKKRKFSLSLSLYFLGERKKKEC